MSGDASSAVAGTGQEAGTGRDGKTIRPSPRSLLDQIRAYGRKTALELRRQLVESIGPLPTKGKALRPGAEAVRPADSAERLKEDAFEG